MQVGVEFIRELTDRGYKDAVLIGKGAFSEVFRVWDEKSNCFRCCKISQTSEMANGEAQMLKCLSHPIFPIYVENWRGNYGHCMIMEYICGSNLKELLTRRGRFTQTQAVQIAMELAQGICYLHERTNPILFRDLKPDNVMVRQDGRVKLVDVGCACFKGANGTFAGSKGYGAPEQFRRGDELGEESDIYALGKLLYYMLTGEETGKKKIYYEGVSYGLIGLMEQAVQEDRWKRIPDIRVFLNCLSVYVEKRFLRRMYTDVKAFMHCNKAIDFYYMQNIRRGMDNFEKVW